MVRRRGRRGHHRKSLKLLSLAIPIGQAALAWTSTGDALSAVDQFQSYYTGYVFMHRTFAPANLVIGYGPWLAKGLITKFGRPLGIMPKSPIPGISLS